LGSETFTANGTYNANNFNNAKGQPLDGFSQVTVNTPYEAILDGSVETIDTSVTTLRASAFASMTNLTKLVLRNASSLLSTIQNALPTDLSQGAELNIYVPSSSLEDYAALYGSVYTVNDISAYGRYWFTPTTSETTLTSGMYVSGITAYLTSTDPYDGLSIPSTITALGTGSLAPITSPTSALGIYDLKFEGNIANFGTTALTSIDSNFANSACPITKFRYNGTANLFGVTQTEGFFYGCMSLKELYIGKNLASFLFLESMYGTNVEYISAPLQTGALLYFTGVAYSNATLKKVSFPLVSSLAAGCFYHATALSEYNLKSVVSLGGYCLRNTAITKADFPLAVSATGNGGQFADCAKLLTANLPLLSSSQSSFLTGMFQGCSALVSANLQSLPDLGGRAFYSCVSLAKVYLTNPTEMTSFGADCFGNVPSTCKIYFPYAFVPDYWVATNISAYTNLFVGVLTTTATQTLDSTLDISGTSHNVTWYSDENLTTVVSGSQPAGTYYAKVA